MEIKKSERYKRSNTRDDEDEEKNDLIIDNLESRTKEENLIDRDRNFYTEETPDSCREINLGSSDIDFLANGGCCKELRIPLYSKFKQMYLTNEPNEKNDVISLHSNGMENDGGVFEIKVIEKMQSKINKKIKFIKGDLSSPEDFEEHLFSNFLKNLTIQGSAYNKPRQSCLIHLIEKEELNIMRERSPTPVKERKESLIKYSSPMKKSKSNEKLPSIISINGKEIKISDKSVIELKKNDQLVLNKPFTQKKTFTIYSNEHSTIKVPPECRYFFNL